MVLICGCKHTAAGDQEPTARHVEEADLGRTGEIIIRGNEETRRRVQESEPVRVAEIVIRGNQETRRNVHQRQRDR